MRTHSTCSEADGVRKAVAAPSLCTAETSTTLHRLLNPHDAAQQTVKSIQPALNATSTATVKTATKKTTSRPARKATANTTARATKQSLKNAPKPTIHKTTLQASHVPVFSDALTILSEAEKKNLATDVVNSTLSLLSTTLPKHKDTHLAPSTTKAKAPHSAKRSADPAPPCDIPLSDLPNHSSPTRQTPATPPYLTHLAKCARIAFAYLRSTAGDEIPLSVLTGMSAFSGRLITHGLEQTAIEELRVLKACLASRASTSDSSPTENTAERDDCASLLSVNLSSPSVELLSLVVQLQIQVLRVISSTQKLSLVESSLHRLDPGNPFSPTATILESVKYGTQPDKAAKQLDTLARTLDSLRLRVEHGLRPSLSPEDMLKLQVFALDVRRQWWTMAERRPNLTKDLYYPLSKALDTYKRTLRQHTVDSYQMARSLILRLIPPIEEPDNLPNIPLYSVYRSLSLLERAAGITTDSLLFFDTVERACAGSQESYIIELCSGMRSLALRIEANNEPVTELATRVQALDSRLNGQSNLRQGLDLFFMDMLDLRKVAISTLNRYYKAQSCPNSDATIHTLSQVIFLCVRSHVLVLRQSVGGGDDLEASSEVLHEAALTSATQTINSTLMACNLLFNSNAEVPSSLESTLSNCCALAEALNNSSRDSHFVAISNLYWRFHQRQEARQDAVHQNADMLRKSIDILSARPMDEQKLGFVAVKLERLGAFLEATPKYSEALETFTKALEIRLSSGGLSDLMEAASKRPLRALTQAESGLEQLLRSFHNVQRISLREELELCAYLVDGSSVSENAVLLELQMYLLEQSLNTPSLMRMIGPRFDVLVKRVLSILTPKSFPIRRAFCFVCILQLAKEHAYLFSPELIKEAESYHLNSSSVFEDAGLLPLGSYVDASLKLAQALHKDQPSRDVVMDAMNVFAHIVEASSTWKDLEEAVDSVDCLVLQLKTIHSFMSLKSHDENCLKALRTLMHIHDLEHARNTSASIYTATQLATTQLRLGYSGQANATLVRMDALVDHQKLSQVDLARLKLAKCHIALASGDLAGTMAMASDVSGLLKPLESSCTSEMIDAMWLRADLASVLSSASLISGDLQAALSSARRCVKISQAMLGYLKQRRPHVTSEHSRTTPTPDGLVHDIGALSISGSRKGLHGSATESPQPQGPSLWMAIILHLRGLQHLYAIYTHIGSRSEAEYYADQARKLSSSIEPTEAMIHILSLDAQHANALDEISDDTDLISMIVPDAVGNPLEVAKLYLLQAAIYAKCKCWRKASATYETVVSMLLDIARRLSQEEETTRKQLLPKQTLETDASEIKRKPATLRKQPASRKRVTVKTQPKVTRCAEERAISKGGNTFADCAPIADVHHTALVQKASILISQGQSSKAEEILVQLRKAICGNNGKVVQSIAEARLLMLRSSEEAAADFTFNVLPESTISFPALASTVRRKSHNDGPRSSLLSPLQPQRMQKSGSPKKSGRKVVSSRSFTKSLFEARDQVWALQSEAAKSESMPICYRICELTLQSTILLSAIDTEIPMPSLHPTRAALSMELPRIESVRRELSVVNLDSIKDKLSNEELHKATTCDLSAARFQQDYIDIIPESWAAVSLSMSEDCSELYIVRYQGHRSPFIIRLPMVRHKLQDLDEDSDDFDFDAGRTELHEIIDLSNFSCHNAPDINTAGAKTAWWEEREALDRRMQELLANIESIWLGGFKGVLSQHHRDSSLLARFRKSFENILNRHLPSRQGTKAQSKSLTLDSNVLQLFIGLGDDEDGAADIDEHLLDLLYFVIDVLQFNGERNAYDEVDFDSMATETLDALRAYHEAASSDTKPEDGHLILILDKRLHAFPWESLPCLEEQSVSRVGSMFTLRERILHMRRQPAFDTTDRYLTSKGPGTYILNPGMDLAATQNRLEPLLKSIIGTGDDEWTAMVNHAPSEREFSDSLSKSSMFLYFGHGSGNQYIRNRAVKKLDKCAEVVWLMGCSSGTVTENGEFEPTSVPLAYMAAGRTRQSDEVEHDGAGPSNEGRDGLCMAVIATLWDVTDGDIDRFSKTVGEEWGLWSSTSALLKSSPAIQGPPKTPAKKARAAPKTPMKTPKGRGKQQVLSDEPRKKKQSLIQAVVKGRESCTLRYLNGAATVVYGVPVYLGE